jgi:hypothetical protein
VWSTSNLNYGLLGCSFPRTRRTCRAEKTIFIFCQELELRDNLTPPLIAAATNSISRPRDTAGTRVGYSVMRSSLLLFLGCITHLAHAHSYGPAPRLPAPIFVNPQQQHAPNCYGFPDQPFTGSNYVNICDPSGCGDDGLGVKTNDVAPNFQLSAVSGEARHDLYALLQSKPVFIQFGSYT